MSLHQHQKQPVMDHLTALPLALQRKCACGNHTNGGECKGCAEERSLVQRRANSNTAGTEIPSIVHDVLRQPGQPLDAATLDFMETHFGNDLSQVPVHAAPSMSAQAKLSIGSPDDRFEHEADRVAVSVMHSPRLSAKTESAPEARLDFSQVRVHTGAKAAESARAVNALAYTVGRDVVFGAGQYAPATSAGKHLLAHELAHTVQQTTGVSRMVIQRMIACPATLTDGAPVPSGFKAYNGNPCAFHCCFRGILEDRTPTPEDPQNECFYDDQGTLVDASHPRAGCRGTPNQYDSATNPLKHTFLDTGGIVSKGWGAFWESRGNDVKRAKCFGTCQLVPGAGKFHCFQQCMGT